MRDATRQDESARLPKSKKKKNSKKKKQEAVTGMETSLKGEFEENYIREGVTVVLLALDGCHTTTLPPAKPTIIPNTARLEWVM